MNDVIPTCRRASRCSAQMWSQSPDSQQQRCRAKISVEVEATEQVGIWRVKTQTLTASVKKNHSRLSHCFVKGWLPEFHSTLTAVLEWNALFSYIWCSQSLKLTALSICDWWFCSLAGETFFFKQHYSFSDEPTEIFSFLSRASLVLEDRWSSKPNSWWSPSTPSPTVSKLTPRWGINTNPYSSLFFPC